MYSSKFFRICFCILGIGLSGMCCPPDCPPPDNDNGCSVPDCCTSNPQCEAYRTGYVCGSPEMQCKERLECPPSPGSETGTCCDPLAKTATNAKAFLSCARWDQSVVTWWLEPHLDSQTRETLEREASRAFSSWDAVCGLTFARSGTRFRADVVITFEQGVHGDSQEGDGAPLLPEGSSLGHAFFPCTDRRGQIHLRRDGDWSNAEVFFGTLLHEIGHALGLEHTLGAEDVMYFVCDGTRAVLSGNDIDAIQQLYGSDDGSRPPSPDPPRDPRRFPPPPDLSQTSQIDSDGDGIPDSIEIFVFGTDPDLADTDGDGVNDAMEIFQAGTSPLVPDDPCQTDEDCDDDERCTEDVCFFGICNRFFACEDGDACTADSCDSLTGCVNAQVECPRGQKCDAATGRCADIACQTPEDCNDNNQCTDQNCEIRSGRCNYFDIPCPEGMVCDPRTGQCGSPCETHEACADDQFCNGEEQCTNGTCQPGTDPCASNERCDEELDECSPICLTNDDCLDTDEFFCNGKLICDSPSGTCVPGPSPCDPTMQTCNEETDTCIDLIDGELLFTLNQDNLTGTASDDVFIAPLAFNPTTGVNAPTLQTGDMANGLGGDTDTLNATLDAGANNSVVTPRLTGIEVWNLTDFGTPGGGATTLSAINATGLTTINSVNSSDDAVTVTNVNSLVNFGVNNTTSDLLVTLIAPATNANNDASTLTLNGSRAGATVTITTPVNGIETLTVASQGSAANVLDALTIAGGTTLTTLNVSGSAQVTITGALNNTLTTVNAGMATGDTSLNLTGNALVVAYTGGAGNDTINFGGGYASTDTINGGAGTTNTLALNSAQAVAATTQQSNVSNIQRIQIVDSLNGAVDVTKFGATVATAATDATLDTAAAATALTAGASTVTLGTGNRSITLNNDDTAHTLNVVVSGAGTADTLTVNLQNADLGNTLTATGAETVSLVSSNGSDGTAADGNANTGTAITLTPTFGAGTLNLSGSVGVTLTGAVSAATINASALTAAFIMGAESTAGGGATITGSGLNDTLFGSANSDSISGGDGNDKIVGRAGGDSIIGGNGVDTYQYQQTTDGGAANADNVGMDLINGFTIGAGGDVLAFQDDIFFNNGDTLDLDIITGAAAGNVVTGFTDGGATAAQVVVQTTPLTNFAAVATLFTSLDAVATTTELMVIAEVSGVGTFVFYDSNSAAADGERVLGQLVGVTGANLSGVVAANLAINDG